VLLQRLREYSERLDLPPMLYAEAPVRYIIELDSSGKFLGLTDTADPSSPRTKRGQRRLVPQVQRSSGIRALLLADKADYLLGYVGDSGKPERVAQCHGAFVELLARCAASVAGPGVAG
jgi:CRISPR-associated protein Csd1